MSDHIVSYWTQFRRVNDVTLDTTLKREDLSKSVFVTQISYIKLLDEMTNQHEKFKIWIPNKNTSNSVYEKQAPQTMTLRRLQSLLLNLIEVTFECNRP